MVELLFVVGLPPELYTVWDAYPWPFGEPYCLLRTFLTELTSTASVFTITAFTVERYVAICHPLRAHTTSSLPRVVKTILFLWLAAILASLPYPLHTRTYYYLSDPATGIPIAESLVCGIRLEWLPRMSYMIQASTLLLFVVPMCAMTVLYVRIALTVRRSESSPRTPAVTSHGDETPAMMSMTSYGRGIETISSAAQTECIEKHSSQRQVNSRRTITRLLGIVIVIVIIIIIRTSCGNEDGEKLSKNANTGRVNAPVVHPTQNRHVTKPN